MFFTALLCGLITSVFLPDCGPLYASPPSPCPPCPLQANHVPLTFSQESRQRLRQLQPLLTISLPTKGMMAFRENPDKQGPVEEHEANTALLCRLLIFPV